MCAAATNTNIEFSFKNVLTRLVDIYMRTCTGVLTLIHFIFSYRRVYATNYVIFAQYFKQFILQRLCYTPICTSFYSPMCDA